MELNKHQQVPVSVAIMSLSLQVMTLRYFQGAREQKAELVKTCLKLIESVEQWMKKERTIQISLVEIMCLSLYQLVRAGASVEEVEIDVEALANGQKSFARINNMFSWRRKESTLNEYLLLYVFTTYEAEEMKVVEGHFKEQEKKIEELKLAFSKL